MAYNFVTVEEAKRGLHFDVEATEDNAQFTMLIGAASERIARYIGKRLSEVVDQDGKTNDASVKIATIMLVGYLYNAPDQGADESFGTGTLPKPVSSLIYQLRDPVAV